MLESFAHFRAGDVDEQRTGIHPIIRHHPATAALELLGFPWLEITVVEQFIFAVAARAPLLASDQERRQEFQARLLQSQAAHKFHESRALRRETHARTHFSYRDDRIDAVASETCDAS